MEKPAKREQLASRLGFLLISAGCAIGLGNVWRFPFITGEYGGACFLLLFIVCQLMVMPVMICEFAIGRASRLNLGMALGRLEPRGTKWHKFSWLNIVGIYTLLMFYTTICGWIVLYTWYMFTGTFEGLPPDAVGKFFGSFTGSAGQMTLGMSLSVLCGAAVCFLGLQNGVERIVKFMMAGLFIILVILAVHSMTLPGAPEGLSFYLKPDLEKFRSIGFFPIASAALNQAFFTLSVGVGSMCIFGSYISKEHSLPGEVCFITGMDFLVALIAGLIIFPACFTFGVDQTAGPSLIFITLPNIFANMALGRLWGSLFFLFMAFAALSTVLAVFENIICCGMGPTRCTPKKSRLGHLFLIIMLSMPCVLGYNLWAWDGFAVFGGAVLDFEDFLVSNLFLPLGSLVYLLFCVSRYGWGWDNYKKEVNTGKGLKIHDWMRGYLTYGLPVIVLFIFAFGIYDKFFA